MKSICNRFDAGPFAKVEERFRREILDPAIKLHQDLESSSNGYRIEYTADFERLPLKQIAEESELKDGDTWQRVKGEIEIGKALYCLHPSIVRPRARGPNPTIVAKSIIVVTSTERKRDPNSYDNRDSSKSFMMAVPALIESSLAKDTSSSGREKNAQLRFTYNPLKFTISDSTTDSRSRRLGSHGRA